MASERWNQQCYCNGRGARFLVGATASTATTWIFHVPFILTTHTKGRIMFDVLKEAVYASIGLASLTREKAEQLAAEVGRGPSSLNRSQWNFKPSLTRRTEQAPSGTRDRD